MADGKVAEGEVGWGRIGWRRVTSGVPQGSVLGPVLFLIFINDVDKRVTNSILKFADDTKIFGGMQSEDDREGIQGDLDSLLAWAHDWKMEFNVEKCKIMHIGKKNSNFT